jgi:hypothetical protein
MKEQDYQSKIMKNWYAIGGYNVNGNYTKAGEADIQGGYPVDGILRYLVVEVKTEKDYHRVMSGLTIEGGLYAIRDVKKLKDHEPLQIHKINEIRKRGGLALVAYNFKQVQMYVKENT